MKKITTDSKGVARPQQGEAAPHRRRAYLRVQDTCSRGVLLGVAVQPALQNALSRVDSHDMFGTYAFRRSRSTATAPLGRVTSHQHRCRLEVAELARQKLAIFAEPGFTNMWTAEFAKVGQHEGCGLLLAAAEMDAPGTKKRATTDLLDGAEESRGVEDDEDDEDDNDVHWEESAASRDAQRQVENLLSFASTAMVISGLCLSISIPLSLSALDGGGTIDTDTRSLGGEDGDGGSSSPVGWYEKWNESSARHALHWTECALLAISVLSNFLCMCEGFSYFGALTLYLPNVESRMRYLLEHKLENLTTMWGYPIFGLYFLILAMPLIAARFSPAATIILSIPALAVMVNFRSMLNVGHVCAKMQHELAREVLKRADRR